MNGQTRKKLYVLIVKSDGEYCRGCGIPSSKRPLVIDHKNNDNSNNDLSNLQLLCRTCNYLKNPRRPLDLSEREDDGETELQKSRRLRPLVKHFILHEINEREKVPEKELLDGGAEEFSCSQQTIKRILDAMCSFRGILERVLRGRTWVVRYKDDFYRS